MSIEFLRAVFGTVILGVASYGAGFWIQSALPPSFSRSDRLAFSCLAGLGILGISLFLVGQVAFTPLIIGAVLSMAVLSGIVNIARNPGSFSPTPEEPGAIPILPVIVIAFVLILTAVAADARIVGYENNDAIAYHFLGPKVWLRHGTVRPLLDTAYTAFPATMEMLYGALMVVGGPLGPGFSAVLTLTLFFCVVFSLSGRVGLDQDGAWWCVALVAIMPSVYVGGHSGYLDVFFASIVLAAARVGFDAERPAEYAVFGLFCGVAMATKYTGLLAVSALVLCAIVAKPKATPSSWSSVLRGAAISVAIASLLAAPYYVRNWIVLGCPIYPPPPGLSNFCHTPYLSAEAIQEFHSYIRRRGEGLGHGLRAYLMLPFNITYHIIGAFHGRAGGIGLAPLALGFLGSVAAWRDAFSRRLALLGWFLLTLWFFTQQESRFLIHGYAIGGIFAVLGWRYAVRTAGRSARLLSGAVVALSVLYGCYGIVSARQDDLHAVVSRSFAQEYRQEWTPYYDSFRYLNREPAVRKVLILDPTVPPYYSDNDYLEPFGFWGERALPGVEKPEAILKRLHEFGITHVLDVDSGVSDFRVPDNSPGLTLVLGRPDERVYRVE